MHHCRNDAGGTIGGRSDYPAPGCVFFINGKCVQVYPVHGAKRHLVQLLLAGELTMQPRGTALDFQTTRQHTFSMTTARDTGLHHRPDI